MTGTLHVWKRSSRVGSLLGGLFSFSKKTAICTRTGERTPPCYLAVLLTSKKAQGDLGQKERPTGPKMSIQSIRPYWSPARHRQYSREENKEDPRLHSASTLVGK